MTRSFDPRRRRLLAAGAAGAGAGLAGVVPASLAQQSKPLPAYADFKDPSKVIVHTANTIETRRDAFGASGVTAEEILFVRNNVSPPDPSIAAKGDAWQVEIDGVASPHTLSVADLKRIGVQSVAMVLQCSGNGRGFFDHKPSGTPWTVGAAGNTLWGGVPVKALVGQLGGVRQGMRYMTGTGAESVPPGIDPKAVQVERSVPWTAMEDALLAWELNGEAIPLAHGGPLRLIVPGYYGVNNIKYIRRLAFTEAESPAAIQQTRYRVSPIGQKGEPSQPSVWELNVKSFVTNPAGGAEPLRAGTMQVHGVAFSANGVKGVEVSSDGGRSWRQAPFFGPEMGRYAWRQFVLPVRLERGTYVFASRATSSNGDTQPEQRLENEAGYGHNGWRDHAVKVSVA